MKVQELVSFVSENKNKMLKAEQLQEVLKKKIEVKQYLSIKKKKELVEDIIDACILYEDGVFKFDDIAKYICFTMKTVEAYTNIELSNDIEEDYDMLCESNILDVIIETFSKEYNDVNVLLQMKCNYILNENNIEVQLGKFLNTISNKVDSFSNMLAEMVGNFDMSQIPISQEDLGKLLQFIKPKK